MTDQAQESVSFKAKIIGIHFGRNLLIEPEVGFDGHSPQLGKIVRVYPDHDVLVQQVEELSKQASDANQMAHDEFRERQRIATENARLRSQLKNTQDEHNAELAETGKTALRIAEKILEQKDV
jgi:hypothetical protein